MFYKRKNREKNVERSTRVNESRGDDLYICFLFGFFLVSLLIEYRDRGANGAVASGQMGAS